MTLLPSDQLICGVFRVKPGGVAFAHDLPAADHREGSGVLLGSHRRVERRVERGPVHAGLVGFLRPDVPERPVLLVRRRLVARDGHGGEVHRILAVHQQRASLIPVVLRGARGHVGCPDGGALRLHVHFPLEVVLPGEADEGLDVLGQHRLRRTLGDPPHDEGAGTEMVRAHPGGVLPEAVVGDVVRRRRSAGATGNERGRYRETQGKPESPCCLHRSILPLADRFYGSRAGRPRCQLRGGRGRH